MIFKKRSKTLCNSTILPSEWRDYLSRCSSYTIQRYPGHMPIACITLSLGAAREIPVQSGYYNTGTLPPMRYLSNDNITLQWSYVQCLRWIIGSSERMLHRMNDIRIVCDVIGYRLKLPIKNSRIVQEASKICKIVITKETMAPSCRDTLFLLVSNPLVPLSLNDIHPSEEVKDS